jgi:hypothetical protein
LASEVRQSRYELRKAHPDWSAGKVNYQAAMETFAAHYKIKPEDVPEGDVERALEWLKHPPGRKRKYKYKPKPKKRKHEPA